LYRIEQCGIFRVAPRTGARIETIRWIESLLEVLVAPRTGARIETDPALPRVLDDNQSHPARVRGLKHIRSWQKDYFTASHPARVRGLKLFVIVDRILRACVAPRTGARIETFILG